MCPTWLIIGVLYMCMPPHRKDILCNRSDWLQGIQISSYDLSSLVYNCLRQRTTAALLWRVIRKLPHRGQVPLDDVNFLPSFSQHSQNPRVIFLGLQAPFVGLFSSDGYVLFRHEAESELSTSSVSSLGILTKSAEPPTVSSCGLHRWCR